MIKSHACAVGAILVLLFALTGAAQARSVYLKQFKNNHELEVETGAYYSNVDYYVPLTRTQIPCLLDDNELSIYKDLIINPVPRFFVAEASVNPLPCTGVLIRKNYPDFYNRADISENFNLIQGVCAGFEEPYAGSLFLGNVVSFQPKGTTGCEGKGYAGALVSFGDYHIKDSELIDDKWWEGELKLKGDKRANALLMSWSFRVGAKFHANPYIKDVFYFSLRRDRVDYDYSRFSLFRNSGFEYTVDVASDDGQIIRHYFTVNKKFPMKKYGVALRLDTGFIWEKNDKYTGPLARPGSGDNFQVIFRPNLDF